MFKRLIGIQTSAEHVEKYALKLAKPVVPNSCKILSSLHRISNSSVTTGPLATYFKGEGLKGENVDVFTANMYLVPLGLFPKLIEKQNVNRSLKLFFRLRIEYFASNYVPSATKDGS